MEIIADTQEKQQFNYDKRVAFFWQESEFSRRANLTLDFPKCRKVLWTRIVEKCSVW